MLTLYPKSLPLAWLLLVVVVRLQVGDLLAVCLRWGSMSIGDPSKSHQGESVALKTLYLKSGYIGFRSGLCKEKTQYVNCLQKQVEDKYYFKFISSRKVQPHILNYRTIFNSLFAVKEVHLEGNARQELRCRYNFTIFHFIPFPPPPIRNVFESISNATPRRRRRSRKLFFRHENCYHRRRRNICCFLHPSTYLHKIYSTLYLFLVFQKMGHPRPLLIYFRSFQTIYRIKPADFRGIQTRIVGEQGKHADHLTSTTISSLSFSSR